MKDKIEIDFKDAMRSHDKLTLSVIRMVKGAIQMEELNTKKPLTDEEIITIIGKQIKTRKESIIEFEKGNRGDLIDQTNKEIEILNKYMPEQLTDEEVNKIIDDAFNELNPTISDMGKVMGYLTPKLKGKTDMGNVSRIIKERLGN